LFTFESVARSLVRAPVELTVKVLIGVLDPIPTRPFEAMLNHCAPDDEATVKILLRDPDVPVIERLDPGVVDPIPTLPFWRIVKSEVPVDDATLNGLTPAVPCTLKVTVDEVALTPDTVPLSWKSPVDKVEAELQRASLPATPPERDEVMPSVDVATQRVDVPVD
jgi:hypothetical protein